MGDIKIEKAPGAKTNTFTAVIDGMSMNYQTMKGQRIKVNAFFTSEDSGETLSLTDPTTKKQIIVPFEAVEKLVDHTRWEW